MTTIHHRIRERRLALGMSMETLAKAVGLRAWQAVQQWEKGKTAPNRNRLGKVAHALGVTKEYLITGRSAPGNDPPPTHPNKYIAEIVDLMEAAPSDDVRAKCVGVVIGVLANYSHKKKKRAG